MKCNRCKADESTVEFDDNRKRCKKCREYSTSYYITNRESEIARSKTFIKENKKSRSVTRKKRYRRKPETYMLIAARGRAKRKGIPFDLSLEDIEIPATCPILGIKIKVADGVSNGSSPSLDRIVPSRGYIKSNVHVISRKANTIKSDATWNELKKVTDYLKNITSLRIFEVKKISPVGAGDIIRNLWDQLGEVDEKLDYAKLKDKEDEVRSKMEKAQILLDDLVCLLNPSGKVE